MKTFLNWFLVPLAMTLLFFGLVWYYNTIIEALLITLLTFPISMCGQIYCNEVFGEQFVSKPERETKKMVEKFFAETQPIMKAIVNELPIIADVNTIYMMDGKDYMYIVGDGWVMIADNTPVSVKENKPKHQLRLVCTSCGSTNVTYTNGLYKCTYCGTQYMMEE